MTQIEDLNGSGRDVEDRVEHRSAARRDARPREAELRIVTRRRWGGIRRLNCALPLGAAVELYVGRSQQCNHVIVADERVSRQHLRFWTDGKGGAFVQDLGSRAGTRVNGRSVGPEEAIELRDGDEIAFGQSSIRFRCLGMTRVGDRSIEKGMVMRSLPMTDSESRERSNTLVWTCVGVVVLVAAAIGACAATLALWTMIG